MNEMAGLEGQIATAFNVASLLLVFVTLLFGLWYPNIMQVVDEQAEQGEYARGQQIGRLRSVRDSKAVPLCALAGLATWLLLPLTVRVFFESKLALWDFDVARTGLVAIELLLVSLTGWAFRILLKVNRRIKQLTIR